MAKSIFSSNKPYEPKYYGKRKQTAAQQEAARENIKKWNDLVKKVESKDKAKQLKDKYGSTSAVWERMQGNFHISKEIHDQVKGGAREGKAAQDRFAMIVDLVFDGDNTIPKGYDSENLFEAIDEYDPEVENEDLFEQHRHRVDEAFNKMLEEGPPF